MPKAELRRRMRGADAMFLYFEREQMPLHIGSVSIIDGQCGREFEHLLEARLPEIPRYRQRVMFSPMNLTHPAWEYDPNFDIRNHVRYVQLDPPGTEAQLSELAGRVFTPLMDRGRPLWDVTLVGGLEGGRSALISRVHHSMVDGVSGVALMNVMFDVSPKPREAPPAEPFVAPPLPDSNERLMEGVSGIFAETAERLIEAEVTLLRWAGGLLSSPPSASLKSLLEVMPEILRPADVLPFNRPCSGVRGHCWATFPFGETRAIRARAGGTINDVVLTVVAGATGRYVQAHREPVKGRFARLLVPVDVRTDETRGSGGNEISMLPLSVPLDIEDPLERLKAISTRSAAMKSGRVADLVYLIGTTFGFIPPAMQTSLAALPFMPQPVRIVNMVATNVPGPMMPLYANGRQLLTTYPHVPTGAECGISVAVASYNQNMHYGVTSDAQAAPDADLFRDLLIEAHEELRQAAGVPKAAPPRSRPAVAAPPAHVVDQPVSAVAEPVVAAKVPEVQVAQAAVEPGPMAQPAPEATAGADEPVAPVADAVAEAAPPVAEPATAHVDTAAPAAEATAGADEPPAPVADAVAEPAPPVAEAATALAGAATALAEAATALADAAAPAAEATAAADAPIAPVADAVAEAGTALPDAAAPASEPAPDAVEIQPEPLPSAQQKPSLTISAPAAPMVEDAPAARPPAAAPSHPHHRKKSRKGSPKATAHSA